MVFLLLLVALLGTILFAAILRNELLGYDQYGALGDVAVEIAELPAMVEQVFSHDRGMEALRRDRFDGEAGWNTVADTSSLPGYLLLSRFDNDLGGHVVELVDLSNQEIRHTWAPDADTLLADAFVDPKHNNNPRSVTTAQFRAIHPFLMKNGDLIIKNHDAPLLRIDQCGAAVWRDDSMMFHHSTNIGPDGNFWIPSYSEPPSVENLRPDYKDDAVAAIRPDGTVAKIYPLTATLIKNGLKTRLFGNTLYDRDKIHLNDIQPVLADGPYWKRGDLFLSMRNLSMVALYRPSTDEIIWYREGPWSQQHDVDILDDHTIAVFDNGAFDFGEGATIPTSSDVVVYDFAADSATRPYAEAFAAQDIRTLTEGLFELMPGGNLLIEEENSGRILILAPDGTLMTEYINRANDGAVYAVGWSRYVDEIVAKEALSQMAATHCE